MQQPKPAKICLVGQSLAQGGAEKAMGLLSIFLESKGVDVHNVIVLDDIAYPFAGEILNLGKLKSSSNSVFDKARRFMALKRYLDANNFDCILDFRIRVSFWQEFFIRKLLYRSPVFYTVHSSLLKWYFPESRPKAKWFYAKADGIVAVSEGIKSRIATRFGLNNVTVIPNPVDLAEIRAKSSETIDFREKFIVSAGRMDDGLKQFGKLIETYCASRLPQLGVHLVLLGDGTLRPELEQKARTSGFSNQIHFTGFVRNPYCWFANAEFFVLSSQNEGLPMVILESLACGTPVVSFDCVSGPNEMIVHEQNGLLVDDQDFGKLLESLDLLAFDESLKTKLRTHAAASVARFDIEKIGQQWLSYLKIV